MLVEIQQSFLQYHPLGRMHSCSALIMGPGEVGIKGFRGLWLGFSLLSQTEGGIAYVSATSGIQACQPKYDW